jgi:hypothetical protein
MLYYIFFKRVGTQASAYEPTHEKETVESDLAADESYLTVSLLRHTRGNRPDDGQYKSS